MKELDSMYYVYKHYLNERLFYIGKGCDNRAFSFKGRSSRWNKLVAGDFNNIRVEIVGYFESELNAYEVEKLLIKEYNTKGAKLTNQLYNPSKDDLLKEALNMKRENEPLIINDVSSYKRLLEYDNNTKPLSILESLEDLGEGTSVFVNNNSNALIRIKDELVVNGYTPLLVMPKEKYKDKPSEIERKDISEFINKGLVSNKYNCIIIDSCFIEEIKINLKEINAVIINTFNTHNRNKSLLSFNGEADLLMCKVKGTPNSLYNIVYKPIVNDYLNIPLTAEDKDELSIELNIINSKNEILKWTSIRKMLSQNGYIVEDRKLTIDGKRRRVSIISES